MRDAENVIVDRVIVHKIDHLGSDTILSEIELNLAANGMLQEYFSRQVASALGDESTRAARFVTDGGNQDARNECLRILQDEKQFVASSQKLAGLLRNAMANDRRIAPGSLAVCLYSASNYPGKRFLALTKLDPGRALVQTVTKKEGKTLVSFDVQQNVMPTEREPLHKAALIPSWQIDSKYDLLLLDRQLARPADFWVVAFLNTIAAFDPRTTTEKVHTALHNARQEANLTPAETAAFTDWLPGAMQNERATVSGLVKSLPVADEKKPVFRKAIRKLLPGEERLHLDTQVAQKLVSKARFRGDYGIRVEMKAEYRKSVVVSEVTREENGTTITRITLDVPNLEWLK